MKKESLAQAAELKRQLDDLKLKKWKAWDFLSGSCASVTVEFQQAHSRNTPLTIRLSVKNPLATKILQEFVDDMSSRIEKINQEIETL